MSLPRSPMAPPRSFLWSRRIFLTLLTGFVLVPVYVMVSSSLKPLADVTGAFRWLPTELTVRPYIDIWSTVPLGRYFVNSLIVAGAATVCSVVIAVFSAYAVSRYSFRGKRVFTVTVLSTQMFPGSCSCSRCSSSTSTSATPPASPCSAPAAA